MTGPRTERPLRADARRNRERIVAVAAAVVAERGADASLEEIARRAGVGSATLHRHFATRHELLRAVFAGHVDVLCATAEDLLRDPRPGEALVAWLRAVLAHATTHRGLGAALLAGLDDPAPVAAFHGRIVAAADALLARATAAGAVRDGILVTELLQLTNAISGTTEGRPDGSRRAERLLDIALDGIRPPPGTGR